MDLNTMIGFGVAVSVPVWLVVEEIASRRRAGRASRVERKASVQSERRTSVGFKRPAPAMPRQVVSRLSA
ncbi:MAG TPA: hypothetical protein VLG10_04405 [Methylomirabilota bacterium]|nr:hypothetical protein [Methylomirabilota bacterium]